MSPRSLIILVFTLVTSTVHAQNNDVPLQRDIYRGLEQRAARIEAKVHSGLKPVIEQRADLSTTMGLAPDTNKYYWWYTEKLYRDHLIQVRKDDVRISIDPLFQFEFGQDYGDATAYQDTNRYYNNTRGFLIKGDLGERFSFQTMFHETQALVPQYLFREVFATGVMPGQGRLKIQERRKLDYGWSQANISFSPARWLNIQFGHGKHFVGHGYRSMVLSDHALNAPYLKFSALFLKDKVQYTTWHSKQMHGVTRADRLPTGDASESLFYWYRARYNHLSIDLGRAQLGLFEARLYRTIDDEGVLPFDAMELMPVIGVATALDAGQDGSRSLLGLDLRVKITDKWFAYGQYAYDRQSAWQVGSRYFDLLDRQLDLQVEFNSADAYMYMNDPAQLAYMHAGLPLAHPLGAGFQEAVAIVEKGWGRARLQAKVNLARTSTDPNSTTNVGADLRRTLPEVLDTEGARERELLMLDLNASYLFNPKTNLRAVLGVMRRDEPGTVDNVQSTYVYLALRTGLFNRYYDL